MSNNLNNPIDTDGNAITDATELGDIDMSSAKMGDMRAYFVEYIESPETTRTTAYTGVSKDTALRDGKLILYRNQTQASGNWTLNLTLSDGTTTGAKPVYSSGTTNVGTMYKANSVIPMVYRTAANAWYASAGLTPTDLSGKVDKANPAVAGNLASLVAGGGIEDSGIAKTDLASTADATLTPIYSGNGEKYSNWAIDKQSIVLELESGKWVPYYDDGDTHTPYGASKGDVDSTTLSWTQGVDASATFTATRTVNPIIGYTLGSQTDKPLASIDPLLFAQYYPDGSVTSAVEFTPGIKYDDPDTTNRTITVKPFCNTGIDNSSLVGRVVIPPFVDAQGNGYISDDGTRYRVVGVSDGIPRGVNTNLTAVVAPNTVTNIGMATFDECTSLTSVSLPAATTIEESAFHSCTSLTSVSLPAATRIRASAFADCTSLTTVSLPATTTIEGTVFGDCTSLTSVSLPAATNIEIGAFTGCTSLTTVDFGNTPHPSVPTLGAFVFNNVPTTCKIIVPYTQYDAWKAASGWSSLTQEFVRHAEKADKPASFTAGNLAEFDSNGNPVDSGKKAGDFADTTALAPLWVASETYDAGNARSYNGKVYECILAVNHASATTPDNDTTHWKVTDMTSPDATLDITADARLRVMSAEGQELWSQGYALAGESSVTLSCDKVNYYAFASGTVTQAFAMPRAATGKVGDFVLDIDNSANAAADATATLTGWNTAFDIYTTEGEVLSDLLTFAGGEKCELYFSLTAFGTAAKPAWKISKVVVEKQEAGE